MGIVEIILIGIGLSMDAVCVSMSNGMCYKLSVKKAFLVGGMFGLFQGLMPIIGYLTGSIFAEQIRGVDHYIALVLLSLIGGKMIYDGVKNSNDPNLGTRLSIKMIIFQGVATSIDALAVGVSFAAVGVDIFMSALTITICTFILSTIAVFIGNKIGDKLNQKAQIFGGTILILIGIKILIEHLIAK